MEGGSRIQDASINIAELQQEKRTAELRLMQKQGVLEDLRANLRVKEEIFTQSKGYEGQLLNQLKQLQLEQNELESQKRTLEAAASQTEEIK